MSAEQLMRMVMRQIIGRLVRRGVDAGIDRLARGGEDSPEARKRAQSARQGLGHSRRAMKMARKIGRF